MHNTLTANSCVNEPCCNLARFRDNTAQKSTRPLVLTTLRREHKQGLTNDEGRPRPVQ
ncbi:hypothetical protein CY34DRAFT_798120 [Suillus luteus UH-Slu-Lm8-n1]|uniref:Uncharacterized protein n=1 Tax=Suillus luteus UH-Slu-Lm8-n1 TaxID=930992 RepID=A0A0D0B3G4_9AGAM|nr:hypothetical protein CY34DRAFT_798120 [Suillus luteus UH-Slu-Lm8-n1]